MISIGVQDRGPEFAYHGMDGIVGIAGGQLLTAVLLLAFDCRVVVVGLSLPVGQVVAS